MASDTDPRPRTVPSSRDGNGRARSFPRGRPFQSLGQAFSPRSNSLTMMRLGLAAAVAVAHGLQRGFGWQPAFGSTVMGDLAIDGFFVLSGFLVARSFLRLKSAGRYAWHRLLRIMPAFWVCLVVTAVVFAPLAALLVDRSAGSVFTADEDPALRYVLVNAALPILQFDIAGISTPLGDQAFNGALWTLQYEAFCYVVVALLGVVGVLGRRPRWVLVAALVAWVGVVADRLGLIPYDVPVFENTQLLRFLLVFLLGAAGWLFAERIPIAWPLALLSGAVVVAGSFLPDYRLIGAVCFAYLCLYGMVRLPLRWNPRWDLSYGLYVYHYPVQFLLVLAGVQAIGQAPFVVLTIALSLVLAVASWVVVEQPALRHKDARWRGWRPRQVAADRA